MPSTPESFDVSDRRPDDAGLVPAERDVRTGRPAVHDRSDKHRDRTRSEQPRRPTRFVPSAPAPVRPRSPGRPLVVAGAAVAVVAILVGVVLIARSGTPTTPSAAAPGVTTSAPTVAATSEAPASATPAPSAAPSSAATSSAGASVTSSAAAFSPSASPAPSTTALVVPPATTARAKKLVGYAVTTTATKVVEGHTEAPGGAGVKVGEHRDGQITCQGDLCEGYIYYSTVRFKLGASTVMTTKTTVSGSVATPCDPTTVTTKLTRQPDGSYRGTESTVPHMVRYISANLECYYNAVYESVTMVPILS